MTEPIVQVEEGKLRGLVSKVDNGFEYYTFKGIPYAKPPIGELRFAAPEPPEPWDDIRDATKDSNICAQLDLQTNNIIGDEDCLYLNVYTPKLPKDDSLLPTMVYIHGGGFVFGKGTDPTSHGPDFLVQKDVVLVGFNYRLGVLGFINLNRKEATGNMGLRDQVQALKWVQKNIAKFGGDPMNVTIFGASAGSASVEYLLLSPTSKGLFHKGILQSGSSLCPSIINDRNKIKANAYKLSKVAGEEITEDGQLLEYLKGLPYKDLIKFSMTVLQSEEFKGGLNFYSFVPCEEEDGYWEPLISKSIYNSLYNGEFTKVPLMAGFCEREGLIMIPYGTKIFEKLTKEKNFIEHFPFDVDSDEAKDLEARLKNIYLEGDNKHQDEDFYAIDFFSDIDFIGAIYVASTFKAKHTPVYFYEFCYDGALNHLKKSSGINRRGAAHVDDEGYILKSSHLKEELNETDNFVKNTMLSLWTNFAKYGNPTPETDNSIPIKWNPINDAGLNCLVIDKTLSVKQELYPKRMALYQEMFEKKYS